jgi:hypothetical protein
MTLPNLSSTFEHSRREVRRDGLVESLRAEVARLKAMVAAREKEIAKLRADIAAFNKGERK